MLLAVLRVIATYSVYSHTYDEPVHLAAGVAWRHWGTYTYELQHPPLARSIIAVGPRFAGAHPVGQESVWGEGGAVMRTGAGYDANLRLARMGVLPFFLLACFFVWWWGRRLGGEPAGAFAVVIFSLVPGVIGHAGLATTDTPLVATLLALCAAWLVWAERPRSLRRAAILGVAGGVALATKFSSIPYFGAALLVSLPLLRPWRAATAREVTRSAALAALAAFVVVWTCYRFSVGPVGSTVLPMPEFFAGLAQLTAHNRQGHFTYLLGTPSTHGRLAFFPVVLAVKTPLSLLFLMLLTAAWSWRQWRRLGRPGAAVALPLLIALAIFGIALAANINAGVRHILPVYALVAVSGGAFAAKAWASGGRLRALTAALAGVLVLESTMAHPDALAYFNALAPNEPGRVLVDSDLDWGQDLHRLRDTVRARRITHLALAYYGSTDHARDILPALRPVSRHQPDTGWIAISETYYRMGAISNPGGVWRIDTTAYRWLHEREPVARIGKSIRLYRIVPRPPRA